MFFSNDSTFCRKKVCSAGGIILESVGTHLFTNIKLPGWDALIRNGRLSSLDWGCLFFSLPVTPSPHRQTESYTLHVHIRERSVPQRHGITLLFKSEVYRAVIYYDMSPCHTCTHWHFIKILSTSLQLWNQIIFIQNKTWWECLRNKAEQ